MFSENNGIKLKLNNRKTTEKSLKELYQKTVTKAIWKVWKYPEINQHTSK